jgi:hypothetical protein
MLPLWPTPPPPPPRRSRRALWWSLGAAALVLVVLGGGAAVAFWPKSTSGGPAVAASAGAASAPAAAATGGAPAPTTAGPLSNTTYKSVPDLCAVADVTPLLELYPMKSQEQPGGSTTDMRCRAVLQSETVAGALSMHATLGQSPATVRTMYEGLRRADQSTTALIDVPGLGTGAYWHLDVRLGTELVAYDGNLYFRVLWGDLRTPSKTAPDIIARLTTLTRNTMAKLKA